MNDRHISLPTANNLVKFTIDGDGRIINVGGRNPSSHEPDKAHERQVLNGLCMAIVQAVCAGQSIRLTATTDRLTTAMMTIDAKAATDARAVE